MGADESGVFDPDNVDERPAELDPPKQRPMEVDSSRYFETGHAAVGIGPDGLPVIAGESPPGPDVGLAHGNLVCTAAPGRPECEYYAAMVKPADGVAKGFGELRQIRRFCRRLSTAAELFEITGSIYGCTLRSPQDSDSIRVIQDFERKQRDIAAEHAEQSTKVEL